MDLNDFTSAENKKVSSENDIPTFTPPAGDAPKVGVDGKSKKAPFIYTQLFSPLSKLTSTQSCPFRPGHPTPGSALQKCPCA